MGQPDVDRAVAGQPVPRPRPGQAGHLPPGQCVRREWVVQHYGRVPRFRPETWSFTVFGATGSGQEQHWDWPALSAWPRCQVVADLHCVTKITVPGIVWEGIPAVAVLHAAPPAADVTHVMVWAEYGYSANLSLADFAADTTLLATHAGGAPLTPDHGYPLRLAVPHLYGWKSVKWVRAVEYLTADRRGFWEERGYHNSADPWREQRFAHQER